MLGRKERSQLELFITGSLRQLVPKTMCSCVSIAFSICRGCAARSLIAIVATMVGPVSILRWRFV